MIPSMIPSKTQLCLLSVLCLLACLTQSPRAAANEAAGPARTNVLFCLADDWGWPHAGVYGDPVVKTPAFDRIAKEGVLFNHAYISSPSCTPCRNSIVTGQQFFRLETGANLYGQIDIRHPNFMFMMREAGYEIGHWRKAWGPGKYSMGGYKEHPCGPKMSFTKFMKERDTKKPFCFWFGSSDPHRGYKYGSGEKSGIDLNKVPVPDFWPNTHEVRNDIADYYFEVQRWDSDVAKAMQMLAAEGILEDTVIVMTGDHGMPFPRCKGNLYDWGSRVPLALRWGKNVTKPGRIIQDFVSLTDLAPTFLEVAGIEVPAQMSGKSLMPIIKSDKSRVVAERDHVIYGRERHTECQEAGNNGGYPSRAIRTEKYMYILNHMPDRWPAGTPDWNNASMKNAWLGDCDNSPTKSVLVANKDRDENFKRFYELNFGMRPAEELYIISEDRTQINNVASNPEYASIKKELAERLRRELTKLADPRVQDPQSRMDRTKYLGGVPKWQGDQNLKRFKIK